MIFKAFFDKRIYPKALDMGPIMAAALLSRFSSNRYERFCFILYYFGYNNIFVSKALQFWFGMKYEQSKPLAHRSCPNPPK
jgi:hypothetical protein